MSKKITQIHLLDIIQFTDTMAAFTSYVLMKTFGLKLAQMHFTPCSIKFGKAKIIYRVWLISKEVVAEFFIVANSKNNKPMAMVSRMSVNGKVQDDSLAYTSYSHKIQYHHDGVMGLIKSIPEQSPVTYYSNCDCDKEVKH